MRGYASRCARKKLLLKFHRRTDISRPLFAARIGSVWRILSVPVIGGSQISPRGLNSSPVTIMPTESHDEKFHFFNESYRMRIVRASYAVNLKWLN